MPTFATNFGYRKASENTLSVMETKMSYRDVQQIPVLYGDKIMVVFKDCYIRKKQGSIFHGNDNHVNVTISFQMKTGTQSSNFSFPATRFSTGEVPIKNIVILPPTPIQDYFSLTVSMISTSELKAMAQKISPIMSNVSDIVKNIPGGAGPPVTAVGIAGDIINIIVALSPEESLINNQRSYIVDKVNYPENNNMDYFMLGTMDVYEDDNNNARWKDGKYVITNEDGKEEEATRITLEFIQCPKSPKISP
ncbi:hypothetical protein [Candidatus Nitrosotalea okcheonensis]|uniref:Uncharacterized protein n=1 Tax=Candidatus Nitrosotalea okcheonensis TaxID=1903276 RepID=A0A2H1FC62_9ARCH|nr:hypothetical protein [Candidatus Nitrosotalea okcheonensis]SMH70352.1 protein of unknown function [Candidatus Nitrosotalea okcheonensis]